ncbi:hypothetical protein GCM10009858_36150 [Terrabacter carboxydivorans]|uniref:Uncharacterized protein n=2 Tax=Terrabacter carboxydivorans TaxID=619730 RepID=A0ABP5ZEG5_9MICO
MPDISPDAWGWAGSHGVLTEEGAGSSLDGKVLFGTEASENGTFGNGPIKAWSIPSLKPLFVVKSKNDYTESLSGVANGILLITRRSAQTGEETTAALDQETGALRWALPVVVGICGASSSQLSVSVNSQRATLDPHTGKQLSYSANDVNCVGPISMSGLESDGNRITQRLAP